jgi:hypothetical protein
MFAPYQLYAAALAATQQGVGAFVEAYSFALEGAYALALQQMRFASGLGQVMATATQSPDDPQVAETVREEAAEVIGAPVRAARRIEAAQRPAPAAVRLAAIRAASHPSAAA